MHVLRLLLAFALVSLLSVACPPSTGDDDDDASTPSPSGATPTPSPTPTPSECPSKIFDGAVVLNGDTPADPSLTPADLEGVTDITGPVQFSDCTEPTCTTWLSALSCLRHIGGGLLIQSTALPNLDPLGRLETISEDLRITSNDSLRSLVGFSSLRQIGSDLILDDHPSLESLSGLELVAEVPRNLTIRDIPLLSDLNGPSALTRVGGNLTVSGNHGLANLAGLEQLATVEGAQFRISFNQSMRSLTGLDSLTRVAGELNISQMEAMSSLAGAPQLSEVGNLQIANMADLQDLSGLGSLSSVGPVYVAYNPSLTSLSGLPGASFESLTLRSNPSLSDISILIGRSRIAVLDIEDSPDLYDLRPLNALTSADTLELENLPITDLEFLSALSTVTNTLTLAWNPQLASVSSLSALTTIREFSLTGSPLLTSLDGLQNLAWTWSFDLGSLGITSLSELSALTTIDHSIGISNNLQLPDCEVCGLLGRLNSIPVPPYFTVAANLADSCTPVGPTTCN
jgi:hypothetical protein